MDVFRLYFLPNFVLLFICLIIIAHGFYSLKKHPKISVYSILISLTTLILAIATVLETYSKEVVNPDATLVFAILGYALRPTCIYLFILLTVDVKKNKYFYLASIPLFINLTIYLLSFNKDIAQYIVYFTVNDDGTELSFGGGVLRYTSHVISLLYLLWLMYLSLSTIKFKRVLRGVITMICSIMVIAAAVIESFLNGDGNIFILNTVIAFSALFYYLYLIIEDNEIDRLTGLYNEERYYHDIDLNYRNINGVAVFNFQLLEDANPQNIDINSVRLEKAASNLIKCITRKMIVYRMDNDEFILFTKGRKEMLEETLRKYKEKMDPLNIRYSVSFAFKENENEPIRNLIFEAERINKLKNLSSRD